MACPEGKSQSSPLAEPAALRAGPDKNSTACHTGQEKRIGRRPMLRVAVAGLLLLSSLVPVACGSDKSNSKTTAGVSKTPVWRLPGADLANSRFVGGPLNSSNIGRLGLAWTVPISASGPFGAYATTPVIAEGIVYAQDLASNVQAIDQTTGKVLWTRNYNSPNVGPDGVTTDGNTIYGATGSSAFALRASNGEQLWIKKLTRNASEGIDMAPGLHDGTVFVSTVPGNATSFYKGDGQAVLFALDATTGATKWKWEEVPSNLWSEKHKAINSGGGLWYPPSFDGKGNLYVGVSNPAPFIGTAKLPWGSSRPGDNLYTDSIVKLNEKTGAVVWHYQLTPHDIYDWDLENSPVFGTAGARSVVIDAGKAGIVVAVDADSGKLLWKTPVGTHNGHDNDNLAANRGDYSKLKLPETVEPGDLGGVESPLATNGRTVVAAVNNLATTYSGQTPADAKIDPTAGTGELVAIDVATGKIKWDARLKASPYGGATIANDVVFTTTFDGTLYGYDLATGKKVWSTRLPGGTNAPVAVSGDTLLAASTIPASDQHALITAFRLGGTASFPKPTGTRPSTSSATTPTSPERSSGAATPTSVGLAAKGNELAYDSTKETAKAGKVTIEFTNNSALQHNVVLETASGKTIGQTPAFSGGSKGFAVTLQPGTYKYFCSVPGHRQGGMEGTLTIE